MPFKNLTRIGVLSIYLSLLSSPVLAQNSSLLDYSMLPFCQQVRDTRTREVIAQSQDSSSGTVDTSIDMSWISAVTVGANSKGSGWNNSNSSSSRDVAISNYRSSDCDGLLQAMSQVTIAEIESNTAVAIEKMKTESWRYGQDIQLAIANVNLEGIKNTNQTSENIANIQGNTNITTTAIQAGSQILGGLINPPSRREEAQANAQVEIARLHEETERQKLELERLRLQTQQPNKNNVLITNDSIIDIDQWLTQRGLTKTACLPGVVFIVGLSRDTVCINPTSQVPSGVYQYDSTIGVLIRRN
jgi:hypothetical protein